MFDYNLVIQPKTRLILLGVFVALCATIGISIGLAFAWSVLLWLFITIFAGSLPVWLPRISTRMNAVRIAELVSLCLLIIIGIGISMRALLPLLVEGTVRVESAVPLLLTTPPLYLVYMILNHFDGMRRRATVSEYMAAVFSGAPMVLTLTMGIIMATYTLLLIHYVELSDPSWSYFVDKFLERGIIPPITLMLFFWGLTLFANKTWVLWREQRLLEHSTTNDKSILVHAYHKAEADTGREPLENFLETLWKKSADSYTVPSYINWAIPILGFIGTVLGISLAADGIQKIISSQSSISQFSSELGQAIAPLGIAFDTTLIALSLSVFLMLLQTTLKRWEDNILTDYESSIRNVANHPIATPHVD